MGRNNSVIENLTTLTLYYCITAVPYLFTTIRVPMIIPKKKQTEQNNNNNNNFIPHSSDTK